MQNEMKNRLKSLINTFFYSVDIDKFYSQNQKEKLVDWLSENGVIVPPCKVGDTVYSNDLDPRFDVEIERIVIEENVITFEWAQYEKGYEVTECWDEGEFSLDDFGKTVFLTKEEAEQALKGHEGK